MFDKPMGGTELMYEELMSRLPQVYKDKFSIFNYPSQKDSNKTTIYWNQLSYDQSAVQFLSDPKEVEAIDHFVFVSHWQAEAFRKMYNIPGYKTHVIKNACIGVGKNIARKNITKLCYTSTPWRGLDVLIEVWKILQPADCELHVFSSCKIYGEEFAKEDATYEHLYQECMTTPGIVYRGSVPNDQLRSELTKFDILAYPNTFEETSCIAVIEALSAGLRVVTSSLGALPETTEGWANIYSFLADKQRHAIKFAEVLKDEIELLKRGKLNDILATQAQNYGNKWSWNVRINDWTKLLNNIIIEQEGFKLKNTWDNTIFTSCFIENEYEIGELKEDDIVIDLGTHIGSFSRICYSKGSRKIYGYEVDKTNFDVYQQNAKEGMTSYNKAVWRSDIDVTTLKFDTNIVDYNTGMGTIFGSDGIEVECVKLDDVLAEFESVRLVKIDVEGSEYPILYTSKQLHKVKEIVGEFHEDRCYDIYNDYRPDRRGLTVFLEDQGFEVIKMEESSWSKTCGNFRAIKK